MTKSFLFVQMICLGVAGCAKSGQFCEVNVMPPGKRIKLIDVVDPRDFKTGPKKPTPTENQREFIEDYRIKISDVWEMINDLPEGKAKKSVQAGMNDIDDLMEKLALGWQP